jgi:prepilin-type processing-associated H-X9-DG protein
MTNYLAVVGDVTAWPGPVPSRMQDFSKGTSHSILLVEQANSGIWWMEPRDLQFDRLDLTIHCPFRMGYSSEHPGSGQAISSEHPKGAHAVFADGSVEFLAAGTSPEVLKDMLVIGGEPEFSLGSRKRLGFVYDPKAADKGPKSVPYRLESFTLEESREPNR